MAAPHAQLQQTRHMQAFQGMVRRPAMEAVVQKHVAALLASLEAEFAAVQRRFEALRREPKQLQGGRTALPPVSGPALAASHLIRRITLAWAALQV